MDRSAERKAWFLGKYMTKTLASFSRAKLRAQLGATVTAGGRGVEATLRLSDAGLAFAQRGFSLRRTGGGGASRLPFRPIPLHLVNDIYQVRLMARNEGMGCGRNWANWANWGN